MAQQSQTGSLSGRTPPPKLQSTLEKAAPQLSGLSQFGQQNMKADDGSNAIPSTFDRMNDPAGKGIGSGSYEEQQANYGGSLPISERGATPVGRGRYDPERVAERRLKAYSRDIDRQLSPFAQAQNMGQPQAQQMSRNSVFGAMMPPPIATQYS